MLMVSACAVADVVVQDTLREQTKQVVNGLVEQRFPGVNAAPVTDCIIDNASTQEILSIGSAAVGGVTPATTDLVVAIASRPNTVTCIARSQGGLFTL
jgi:nucleoside phosphorylase